MIYVNLGFWQGFTRMLSCCAAHLGAVRKHCGERLKHHVIISPKLLPVRIKITHFYHPFYHQNGMGHKLWVLTRKWALLSGVRVGVCAPLSLAGHISNEPAIRRLPVDIVEAVLTVDSSQRFWCLGRNLSGSSGHLLPLYISRGGTVLFDECGVRSHVHQLQSSGKIPQASDRYVISVLHIATKDQARWSRFWNFDRTSEWYLMFWIYVPLTFSDFGTGCELRVWDCERGFDFKCEWGFDSLVYLNIGTSRFSEDFPSKNVEGCPLKWIFVCNWMSFCFDIC